MPFLGDNLLFLRKSRKLKVTEMPDRLGIPTSTWSNYENDLTEPKYDVLIRIAEFFQVDIHALLTRSLRLETEEGKLKGKTDIPENSEFSKGNSKLIGKLNAENEPLNVVNEPQKMYGAMPKVVSVNHTGEENIVFVPVRARAGYLSGYADPVFIEKLPSIHDPNYRNGTYRLFEVEGNSMFPTLHDHDKALCRWENVANIVDGRVYVIVTESDGLLIKRVINRYQQGKIICKSDNNHRGEYPPIILDVHTIREVWYVVEARTRFLSEPGEIYKRIIDLEADMILLKQKLIKE